VHLDELWEVRISLDYHFFEPDQVATALADAGFVVGELIEREPYQDVEAPTRRLYVTATAP
jgi:hypothetical protein